MKSIQLNKLINDTNALVKYGDTKDPDPRTILRLGDVTGQWVRYLDEPDTVEVFQPDFRWTITDLFLTLKNNDPIWASLLKTAAEEIIKRSNYLNNRIRTVDSIVDYISICTYIRFARIKQCNGYLRVIIDSEEGFVMLSDEITLELVIQKINDALFHNLKVEIE